MLLFSHLNSTLEPLLDDSLYDSFGQDGLKVDPTKIYRLYRKVTLNDTKMYRLYRKITINGKKCKDYGHFSI